MIELKDFQQEQYDKYVNEGYCFLAWETGVGKTFPMLKLMTETNEKFFILCPNSVEQQWEKYLTEYKIPFCYYADGIKDDAQAVIAGIEVVTRRLSVPQVKSPEYKKWRPIFDELQLKLMKYNLIIDECHKVKDPTSEIYKILRKFIFKRYAFLSATPIESGAWDNYAYFSICKAFNYDMNPKLKSFSAFKTNYCKTDFFNAITDMDSKLSEEWSKHWSIKKHPEDVVIINEIEIPLTENAETFFKNVVGDYDNFIKRRQIVNGFLYVDIAGRKEQFEFDVTTKIETLETLMFLNEGKFLIFFEFEKEREDLRKIEGGFEYKKFKDIEEFKHNDKKFMFAHYKSISAGVRVSYISHIVLYTIALSNTSKHQAIGRAKYFGRTEPLNVYNFIVEGKFENRILQNNQKKYKRFKDFFLGADNEK